MKHVLAAALAMSLTACVSAQPASPPPHEGTGQEHPTGDRMAGMPMSGMAHHTEGVLAFLEAELKITAAQANAWDAFAAAYRDFAGSMSHMAMQGSGMKCCAMMGRGEHAGRDKADRDEHGGSFTERMAMHAEMIQSRIEAFRKLNAALKPLYASLTKQQRKTADQVFPMFVKMGHMM